MICMSHEPRGRRLHSGARWLALAFALLLALPLALGAADQVWEGNAAVVRKGEFGTPGFFAASDSFPGNTLIQVENPQNGKTVEVTVVERINGRGNVFLLLSEQAAAALGFSASEVIRVRSRVLVAGGAGRGAEDLAASPDPDVNPAAALAGLPAAAEVQAPEPEAATTEEAAEAGEQPPPEEPSAAAMTPSEAPAEAPVAQLAATEPQAATATEPSATDKRLEELAGRMPQKQLFRPPRASEAVAAAPPAEAPPEEALAPAEPPPEEPSPEPSLAQPEATSPQEAPLAEAQAEEEAPPEAERPALSLGAPSSQAEEGQVEGFHEPGAEAEAPSVAETPPAVEEAVPVEPAPVPAAPAPEAEAVTEPVPAEPVAPAQVAAVPAAPIVPEPGREPAIAAAGGLMHRSFYLQLGAYSTRGLADKLARELSSAARYTVAVLPVSSGNRLLYKVLIGPLNRDESGTLLFQFRARGFKDAFVQYVE
jgi:hypothetical protein